MVEIFTQKYADTIVDRLKETWMEDCKTEEMFSVSKFKGKENFFLNHTDSNLKWKSDDERRNNTNGRQGTSKSKNTNLTTATKSQVVTLKLVTRRAAAPGGQIFVLQDS